MTYVNENKFNRLLKAGKWDEIKNVFTLEKNVSTGQQESTQKKSLEGIEMTVLRNGDGIVTTYNADGSAIEGDPVDRFGNPIAEGMVAVKDGYIKDHSVIYIETSEKGEGSHANGKFYYVCDTGGGLVDGQVDVYVNGSQETINSAPYGRTEKATISLVEENVSWDDYLSKYYDKTVSNVSSSDEESNSDVANASSMDLVIATYKEVDGKKTIEKQKINYQIETSKYATPVEFLMSHLQVSNDPKYVKAIVDMVVNNSRINYVIQDQYNETTVDTYESYTVNQYATKEENGRVMGTVSQTNVKYKVSTKTTKTISIVSYIKSADTWIAKVKQKYVKKGPDITTTKGNEKDLGNGAYDANNKQQIVNRKQWDETTVYSVTYIPAVSTSNQTSDDSNTNSNSEAILGNNEIANKILTIAEQQKGVPYVWGGTSPMGFDCSGLVQYCCQKAGANIPPRVTTDYPLLASKYEVGWNDMQPGDILWNSNHVGIYIGNGNFIHAPKTGDVVKVTSISGYGLFKKVYRFW